MKKFFCLVGVWLMWLVWHLSLAVMFSCLWFFIFEFPVDQVYQALCVGFLLLSVSAHTRESMK